MKRLMLAWTAFLGLASRGSGARATLFDFTYTGSLVDFTVPTTDSYQILAFGAQAGSGTFCHRRWWWRRRRFRGRYLPWPGWPHRS
jgi:hypothetical protein